MMTPVTKAIFAAVFDEGRQGPIMALVFNDGESLPVIRLFDIEGGSLLGEVQHFSDSTVFRVMAHLLERQSQSLH